MNILQKTLLSFTIIALTLSTISVDNVSAQNSNSNSVIQMSTELDVGSRGELVKILQSLLASDPTILNSKYITGYFGPITKNAVKKFQNKNGIASVGRVGPKTLEKMNQILASSPVTTSQSSTGATCAMIPPGHFIAPGYLKKSGGVAPTKPECQVLPPGILKKISSGGVGSGNDTIAPVISNILVGGISTTAASLTFSTNEDTVFEVMYGPTTSYGTTSTKSTVFGKTQTYSWSGLTLNTTYHYQIKAYDRAGNVATSADGTFTTSATDTVAPTISSISVSPITSNSATISWITNEPATTEIYYGTTNVYGSSSIDATLATTHSVLITGLSASTAYHYQIKSKDGANNIASSDDATFATSATPDTTAPTISNMSAGSITSTTANISFTTNESATGKVYWSTTTPVNKTTASHTATVLGTSHIANLSALTANTTYYYLIEATDASSNMTTTTEASFTTTN